MKFIIAAIIVIVLFSHNSLGPPTKIAKLISHINVQAITILLCLLVSSLYVYAIFGIPSFNTFYYGFSRNHVSRQLNPTLTNNSRGTL